MACVLCSNSSKSSLITGGGRKPSHSVLLVGHRAKTAGVSHFSSSCGFLLLLLLLGSGCDLLLLQASTAPPLICQHKHKNLMTLKNEKSRSLWLRNVRAQTVVEPGLSEDDQMGLINSPPPPLIGWRCQNVSRPYTYGYHLNGAIILLLKWFKWDVL